MAIELLRSAWTLWQELEIPYEGARSRALIGLAHRALGDDDAAELELDAARWLFEQLAATPDVARVNGLAPRRRASGTAGGLTERELQVLRRVSAGDTNRAIAGHLRISEKTVARHVANIFTKLGLSSRAAATAYAYEHGLNETYTKSPTPKRGGW
jgi:DNA-binding CsgD family transcriptional regulator